MRILRPEGWLMLLCFILPYLVARKGFGIMLGPMRRNLFFAKAGLGSTWDYLTVVKVPDLVKPWIEVSTRLFYEEKITDAVTKIRGKTFVDVGASLGYYAALLFQNFEKVIAFEPDPTNFRLLCNVVTIGRLQNVQVSNKAISDNDDRATLFLDEREGHSLRRGSRKGESVTVKTERIDSLSLDLIDLLKVDVEGAEWLVLKGAEESIRGGRIRRVVVEVHDAEERANLEHYLVERGFQTKWLDARHIYAHSHASRTQ